MLEFLIDSIFIQFVWHICQQIISMGTNCVPFLADLSHYSHEPALIQKLTKDKKITVAEAFNLAFRYIGDVL
jgi:hypothetical protein